MEEPLLAALLIALSQSQGGPVGLEEPGWSFEPPTGIRIAEHLGQRALVIGNGSALRRDIRFTDGTVEFDLAASGGRAFVYLQFRMVSDRDHEEVYFRTHKSGLPDAVQYASVHQGLSAWQLKHGPGGTAAAEFARDGWTHIRVVIRGQSLAVFVGDAMTPQLLVPRLSRPRAEGYIALRNFIPAGVDPVRHATGFANLVVRPGVVPFDFSRVVTEARTEPGTVLHWDVSSTFAPDSGPISTFPESLVRGAEWKKLKTDPQGLLNFPKHLTIPPGLRRWATLARLRMGADAAKTVRLVFGFSDEVTVFLNGRPVMSGDQRYSFDNPRQEGLIGFHQATVYLTLSPGENEVILAIADGFGGWGLMGRVEDAAGVRVSP